MFTANDVERVARELVDELRERRNIVPGNPQWREDRWESDYAQKHCFDMLILHYESGDPYVSLRWKYNPIQDMDEAERCFFEDWAD